MGLPADSKACPQKTSLRTYLLELRIRLSVQTRSDELLNLGNQNESISIFTELSSKHFSNLNFLFSAIVDCPHDLFSQTDMFNQILMKIWSVVKNAIVPDFHEISKTCSICVFMIFNDLGEKNAFSFRDLNM